MCECKTPLAVAAAEVPPRTKPSNYPEPFFSRMARRERRPLGDLLSLENFGVNLTTLEPGGNCRAIFSRLAGQTRRELSMMRRLRPRKAALLATLGAVAAVVLTWPVVVRSQPSTPTAVHIQIHGGQVVANLDVRDFRKVEAVGKWRIELIRGDSWEVELTYPENLKNFVRFGLRGDRLQLDFDPPLFHGSPEFAAAARIVMPEIDRLEVKGYSDVGMRNFEGQRLEVDIRGNVTLDGHGGRYNELGLAVSGYNRVDLRGIEVHDADVRIVGNSHVVLSMRGGTLSGFLRGAGTLDYHGQVAKDSVRVAGIARVRRLE